MTITEPACIMALIILFIHAITWKGMILDKIPVPQPKWHRRRYGTLDEDQLPFNERSLKDWMDKIPDWIVAPLWDCIICMAPWYGTAIGLPLFFGSWTFTPESLAFIGLTGGICVIIDTFVLGKRNGL